LEDLRCDFGKQEGVKAGRGADGKRQLGQERVCYHVFAAGHRTDVARLELGSVRWWRVCDEAESGGVCVLGQLCARWQGPRWAEARHVV
jgi:hypothetical protein